MTAAAWLAFIASLVATAVAFYNAGIGRFAEQRWWNRKAETYEKIVEALGGVVQYHEEHYDAALENRQLSEPLRAEIEDYWRRGYTELRKATAIGAFMISPSAQAALKKMWQDQSKGFETGDWFGEIEAAYGAARECLDSLVREAKQDLQENYRMDRKQLAREWLILLGSLTFGVMALPQLMDLLFDIDLGLFYRALLVGNEAWSAWLFALSPYVFIQLIRSIVWAINMVQAA